VRVYSSELVDEEKLLMGCFVYSLIGTNIMNHFIKSSVYLHFAMSAISQFCTVLKIYAFKLGKRDSEGIFFIQNKNFSIHIFFL